MKAVGKTTLALAVSAILVTALTAYVKTQKDPGEPKSPRPPAASGDSIDVVYVQPFTVDQPFTHFWRAERPQVASGYLMVLSVDKDYVLPLQTAEPVLYVGAQTAERVNVGYDSGHVVVIVPGPIDLAANPIFFGNPFLPEEVDEAHVAKELTAAKARGAVAPTIAHMDEAIHVANDYYLRLRATDLIEKYSPQEHDLISGMRAPLIGK